MKNISQQGLFDSWRDLSFITENLSAIIQNQLPDNLSTEDIEDLIKNFIDLTDTFEAQYKDLKSETLKYLVNHL